ncbi:MAG TPA: hypothetical protein PKW37_00425 [Salinivirgaceae bacterium]|nr:hypothetical protein [Salinivirgaceae bacterium]
MKRIAIFFIVALFTFNISNAQEQDDLTLAIKKIAKDLENKHSGANKIKIAILQFRTKDNKLTKFNDFVQEELYSAYKNSARFEVIDQNAINDLIQSYGWTNDKARSFEHNEEFGKFIFEQLGYVANAIIYGQITDNDETITLTAYLVPNGINRNIVSVEKFNSSPFTDKLLGKSIRERNVDPKHAYVEKPTTTILKSKIGDYSLEVTSVALTGNKIAVNIIVQNSVEDGYIYGVDARFFDAEGNEFTSGISFNTLRDRKIIKDIPLKGVINFENKEVARVTEMQALEINVYKSFGSEMHGTAHFYNIPVTR